MDKNPIARRIVAHVAALPRRVPLRPQLEGLGHLPAKHDTITTTFHTVNFSLLASGSGVYHDDGKAHRVVAPAVLTQWPGAPMDYGPHGTWRELFLIYPAASEAHWRQVGLLDHHRPWWRIETPGRFFDALDELLRWIGREKFEEDIDRIDRLAERALLEAFLGAAAPPASPTAALVQGLRLRVDRGTCRDPEAEALAHGLSRSHFRRVWAEVVGSPPSHYVAERRLREAARRLAETRDTVKAIAHDLGFPDPLYFSRRFKATFSLSPGHYRQRHRGALHMEARDDGMPKPG